MTKYIPSRNNHTWSYVLISNLVKVHRPNMKTLMRFSVYKKYKDISLVVYLFEIRSKTDCSAPIEKCAPIIIDIYSSMQSKVYSTLYVINDNVMLEYLSSILKSCVMLIQPW